MSSLVNYSKEGQKVNLQAEASLFWMASRSSAVYDISHKVASLGGECLVVNVDLDEDEG